MAKLTKFERLQLAATLLTAYKEKFDSQNILVSEMFSLAELIENEEEKEPKQYATTKPLRL